MKITRNQNNNPEKPQSPRLYSMSRVIKNLKESGNYNGEFLYRFNYWFSIRNLSEGLEYFISNVNNANFMRDKTIDSLQKSISDLVESIINSDATLTKEADEYVEKEKARRKADEDAWIAKRKEKARIEHENFLDKMLLRSKEYKDLYSRFLSFLEENKGEVWKPIRSKLSEFKLVPESEFKLDKIYVTLDSGIPTVRDTNGNAYTYYTTGTLVKLLNESTREVAVMGPTFRVTSDASFGNRGSTFDTGFSKEIGKMDKSGNNYAELSDFIDVISTSRQKNSFGKYGGSEIQDRIDKERKSNPDAWKIVNIKSGVTYFEGTESEVTKKLDTLGGDYVSMPSSANSRQSNSGTEIEAYYVIAQLYGISKRDKEYIWFKYSYEDGDGDVMEGGKNAVTKSAKQSAIRICERKFNEFMTPSVTVYDDKDKFIAAAKRVGMNPNV